MMRSGELQKYVKSKVSIKAGAPPPWQCQGLNIQVNETGKAGTSKNGELGHNLRVVSFFHQEKDEKWGNYEDFKNRR